MFFWLQKFISLAFVFSTALSLFFYLLEQSISKTILCVEKTFYRFNIFFDDIIQQIFPFRQIVGLSIINKGIRIVLH